MKLILMHGTGLTAQSQRLSLIKKGFDPLSILTLSGQEIIFDKVFIEISTPNLFIEERLVILEDFDDQVDLSKLPKDPNLTVLLRFEKNFSQSSKLLKQAQNLKAQIISLTENEETSIFPFLDNLALKNPQALTSLDKLYDQFGFQYLLTMIYYLLRRFLLPQKKLPSFVIQKIERQKKNFNIQKINSLYKSSLETDFKIKSGQAEEKTALTLLINKFLTI